MTIHATGSCRAWRACHDPAADLQQHMKELGAHFASKSIIEGIPSTLMAIVWLISQTTPCQFVTCDPSTISATFPDYVLTLPGSHRDLSAAEVAALQSASCDELLLTSDGWLTLPHALGSASGNGPQRESGFFERIIEFSLTGAAPRAAWSRCPPAVSSM